MINIPKAIEWHRARIALDSILSLIETWFSETQRMDVYSLAERFKISIEAQLSDSFSLESHNSIDRDIVSDQSFETMYQCQLAPSKSQSRIEQFRFTDSQMKHEVSERDFGLNRLRPFDLLLLFAHDLVMASTHYLACRSVYKLGTYIDDSYRKRSPWIVKLLHDYNLDTPKFMSFVVQYLASWLGYFNREIQVVTLNLKFDVRQVEFIQPLAIEPPIDFETLTSIVSVHIEPVESLELVHHNVDIILTRLTQVMDGPCLYNSQLLQCVPMLSVS